MIQSRPVTVPDQNIEAFVFDAFGTLCHIRDTRRPFAQLVKNCSDWARAREVLMTRPLSLREAAHELLVAGVALDALKADPAAELASIELYPEV